MIATILEFVSPTSPRFAKPVENPQHAYPYSQHHEILAEQKSGYDYQPRHRAEGEAQ